MEMSKKSNLNNYPTLMFLSVEARAKIYRWLETKKESMEYSRDYSFNLLPASKSNGLNILSGKMLKELYQAMTDGTLPKCSLIFPNQDMICGGAFLTPQTTEYHKIENEFSLSELLEPTVSEKYFLKQVVIDRILSYESLTMEQLQTQSQNDTKTPNLTELTSLKVNSRKIIPIANLTREKARQNTRVKTNSETSHALIKSERPGFIEGMKIRMFTPLECERLMSWPDDWTRYGISFYGAERELDDNIRYRLIGNGIVSIIVSYLIETFIQEDPSKQSQENNNNSTNI